MLPSNNFFKHIFCPYDKAKLCHRPYCHYKHAEAAEDPSGYHFNPISAQNAYSSKPTAAPNPYSTNPMPTPNAYSTNPTPVQNSYSTQPTNDNDYRSSYVPQPTAKPGILKRNTYDNGSMVIPEYNPTPISWLKEHNTSNSSGSYSFPSYRMPESRRNKLLTLKKKNTEEYDPTMVKLKNATKKSVMFADDAGMSLDDVDVPDLGSSEEDFDDSGSAPKFSDDDLDDVSHVKVDHVQVSRAETAPPEGEEDELEESFDEKSIDEFSVVDKILVSSKKSEKLISNFKKSALSPKKYKKTKIFKSDVKPPSAEKKHKTQIVESISDVPSKPNKVSDYDAIMSLASFDDLKHNDVVHKEMSSKKFSKSIDLPKAKTSDFDGKKDKSEVNKSKTSSPVKKSKDSPHSSKHSKHNSSSNKSKTKSDSINKQKSSKLEKSTKSDKSNPLKSDKSNSKTGKSDKLSSSKSKSSKDKLQDEKITSSSIPQKSKSTDQSSKHTAKHSDSGKSSSHKSKSSSKEDTKTKHKVEDSDDESNSTKNAKFKSKRHRDNESSDEDESFSRKTSKFKPEKFREDGSSDDSSSVDADVDDVIDISSESEEDTEEQCKRIFEETFSPIEEIVLSDHEDSSSAKRPAFTDVTISKKQRLAHEGATSFKKPASVSRPSFNPVRNPGQVMLDRFAKIQAAQAELNESRDRAPSSNSPGRSKMRISIAPNHSLLTALAEKKRLAESSNSFNPLPPTVTKTLKVAKRVAHIPDVATKPRPIIPIDYGSKVPTVTRQKYLNTFIDEFLKLANTEEEAYANALEEEKKAYGRSSSKAIYVNVASNALGRLRQAVKKSETVSSTTGPAKKTVSHETLLNGPLAQRTSFSIERKKPPPAPELKGVALYEYLLTYVLSEEQLKENGYPFPHSVELGRAVIEGIYANRIQYCNDPFKRTCSRCQKVYYVNVDGDYVRDEECDFHWGRLFKRRIAGALESRYTCCQGDSESNGCCVGTGHVFEGSESHALKGFVNTLPKTPPPDKYYGIYALDCEMCYTTAGVELTRISVIGPDMKPVYETFVKPQNKVLDFNTRFSGITEENLKNCRTTIRDVQAVLLCMFNSRTILIGHSLESDFKALKLFHKTVVDTSVVFPHKLGPPYKRALRNLSSEKLNKIIQNDVGGHDSAEDAVACMELMMYKIKEDLKGLNKSYNKGLITYQLNL